MKLTLEIDCSSEELQWLKNEIIDLCNEEPGGEPVFQQCNVSGALPVAEQGVIDEYGHHTEWKFCPGCGIDWALETGADQFGCWSCGFVRK